MTPSVKTLLQLTERYSHATMTSMDAAKLLRRILTADDDTLRELIGHPALAGAGGGRDWRHLLNVPFVSRMNEETCKMDLAVALLGLHGVEGIPAGRGRKSPAIEYCNAGDSYAITLMCINGNYRVGCFGDVVERGDYS